MKKVFQVIVLAAVLFVMVGCVGYVLMARGCPPLQPNCMYIVNP